MPRTALRRHLARPARALRHTWAVASQRVEAGAAIRALAAAEPHALGPGPRVVVDCCAFQEPHTGIARVWSEVLAEWSASGFARQVVLLDRAGTAPQLAGFSYRTLPAVRAYGTRAQMRLLEAACAAEQADLFVSTLYTFTERTSSLLLVHDLAPEMLGFDLTLPVWRDKAAAIRRATAFACVSQHTADDLLRLYPEARERACTITRPGVSDRFHPVDPEESSGLAQRLGLPERYFMFVGYRDSHKNAELLFKALALMQADPDFGVLAVGGGKSLEPELAAQAGRITVRTQRIDDDELRAAYSGAAALVFVSHYEGFGLVVLEAMACGCPVIACPITAIPEAAGDAALYVDEFDPEQLAQAMRSVLAPEVRSDLRKRGLEHVAGYSWSAMALGIQRALEEAAR